jgi:hypothetical protein
VSFFLPPQGPNTTTTAVVPTSPRVWPSLFAQLPTGPLILNVDIKEAEDKPPRQVGGWWVLLGVCGGLLRRYSRSSSSSSTTRHLPTHARHTRTPHLHRAQPRLVPPLRIEIAPNAPPASYDDLDEVVAT